MNYKQVQLKSLKDDAVTIFWVPENLAIKRMLIMHKESKETFRVDEVYEKTVSEDQAKGMSDKHRIWENQLGK